MLARVLSPHNQRPLGGGLVYLFLGTMSSSRNDHVRDAEARRQAAVETHVALAARLLRLQTVILRRHSVQTEIYHEGPRFRPCINMLRSNFPGRLDRFL